jgi:hypothetical protein
MNSSDIKFYHSGGGSNCDPLLDLGGSISTCELTEGLDMLFNEVTEKQSRAGRIDYRCFYVKNTHPDDTLRNAKFYIDWEHKSGSFVDVGVRLRNEIQKVVITGLIAPDEDDYMTLDIPGYDDFTVDYHSNLTIWQGRFQTAIRGIDGLQDVIIEATGTVGSPTSVTFIVKFVGQAESRQIDLMTVLVNSLNDQTINILSDTEGSPVGIVACTSTVLVAPACVDFNYPLRGSPIELGSLRPGESFPVWVRRTTPRNTRAKIRDKVRFNVDGTFP